MKINVSIQKTKIIMWRSSHKFCLRTDTSRDTCLHALNTQLPSLIAECAIHHCLVMDGRSFGQNQ